GHLPGLWCTRTHPPQQDRQPLYIALAPQGQCHNIEGDCKSAAPVWYPQRFHRYVPRHDYLSDPPNHIADTLLLCLCCDL
ncbi:hypothetical protein ACHAXR_000327, partial [Thalassiosira sp. AJA248-18]